ncbi:unnamed protein product [Malus baccata var. baccata]
MIASMKKARKTKEAARSSKKNNANEKNIPVRPPAYARKRKAASSNESEVVDDYVEDKPSVDGVVDDIQATDDTNVGAIVLVTDDTNGGANISATDGIDVGVDAKVTEPFPGGPTDTSLLKSFKSHVAAAVWNNEERGPLRCMSKWNTLKEWKWQDKQNNDTYRRYSTESFVSLCRLKFYRFQIFFFGVPVTGKAISLQAYEVMSNHELLVYSKTSKLEQPNLKSSIVHAIKSTSVRIRTSSTKNAQRKIGLAATIKEIEFDFPSANASYGKLNPGIGRQHYGLWCGKH